MKVNRCGNEHFRQDLRNFECRRFCHKKFFGKHSVLAAQTGSLWYKRALCVSPIRLRSAHAVVACCRHWLTILMRLTHALNLASLQRRLLSSPMRFLLIPLSWLYGLIVSIRNRLYAIGVFKARRLPCRVMSVGNVTVGGTGKTPAVIAIAKHLQRQNIRVAILLRGYKRTSRERVTIVSDGDRVCATLKESGDEAYMLARHLNGIPIVVGRRRYEAGQVTLERFDVDVLLLDDGFQHRQLARDVDILTVPVGRDLVGSVEERKDGDPIFPSSVLPLQYRERLLPAGTLREPFTALRRADIILLTHTDTVDILQEIKEALQQLAPNALILESVHQPVRLYPLVPKQVFQEREFFHVEKTLAGKRILAVCGIGNPDAFVATLRRYAPAHVALLAFPDHHVYTERDMAEIDTAFETSQSDLIVTTRKDEQKLVNLVAANWELAITVLEVALVITEGVERLDEVLLSDC